MLISIVIPCYRSVKTLPSVVKEIQGAFAKHPEHDYQLILVNDGSPDDTCGTIRALCAEDEKIVGIDLSRNFGQARARMAALPHIKGDCTVYMDDDGQHPADGIFTLVEKLSEGYDVVYARFLNKKHSWFKRTTSEMYRKFMENIGLKPKGVYTSAFFAWSKFAVEALKKYHSPSPSTGSYLLKVTSRFANVEVEHRARLAGESGYSLKKLFALAIMNITSSTVIPLRAATAVGGFVTALGGVLGLFGIIRKLVEPAWMLQYTALIAIILLMSGLILVALGIVGEYVGRMYMMMNDMPQYLIREVMQKNCEDNSER